MDLLDHPGARLIIHPGRGDEPLSQAAKLRAWLISLAVDGSPVGLVVDGDGRRGLSLELSDTTVENVTKEGKTNP